jgi:hypothetical protein
MKQLVAAALAVASLTLAVKATAEDDMATARRFLDAGRYTDAMYYLQAAADTGDGRPPRLSHSSTPTAPRDSPASRATRRRQRTGSRSPRSAGGRWAATRFARSERSPMRKRSGSA